MTARFWWICTLAGILTAAASRVEAGEESAEGSLEVSVIRLPGNPIVRPDMDSRMGSNVQGPSLIRVPDWIEDPLGRYYLYFADHKGSYIRLAYADELNGPWRTYEPGTLQLEESHFLVEPAPVPDSLQRETGLEGFAEGPVEGVPAPLLSATQPHIASPDVHVREDRREIVLYYHGLEGFRYQLTRVATSKDGLHFTARPELLARPYLRAFPYRGAWYGLAMPGVLYRSPDGLTDFEQGAQIFPNTMRHAALLVRNDTLYVFWTRVGDRPEHILLSTVEVEGDWSTWKASAPRDVLFPEEEWEGAELPVEPSVRDAINVRVNQLRDPAIFEEAGKVYLLYAVAGESGIAIAELDVTPAE